MRAKVITTKIMEMSALDYQAFSVVEDEGFHWLIHCLEVQLPPLM